MMEEAQIRIFLDDAVDPIADYKPPANVTTRAGYRQNSTHSRESRYFLHILYTGIAWRITNPSNGIDHHIHRNSHLYRNVTQCRYYLSRSNAW